MFLLFYLADVLSASTAEDCFSSLGSDQPAPAASLASDSGVSPVHLDVWLLPGGRFGPGSDQVPESQRVLPEISSSWNPTY